MSNNNANGWAVDLERGAPTSIESIADEKTRPITPVTPSSTTTLTQNGSPRNSKSGWRTGIFHWFPGVNSKTLEDQKPKTPVESKSIVPVPPPQSRRESIVRQLEECPDGFPRLAAFLDSDDNFMIYRRFGFLHARILLQKQDEIKQIEEQLDIMDEDDKDSNPGCLRSRIDDEARELPEGVESRKELLKRAEVLLSEYGQLLLQAQNLVGMNRPGSRDFNSVSRYIYDTKPLFEGEDDFIDRREDLVTLRPGRECAWLDSFVERILKAIRCEPVTRIFCSADIRRKTTNEGIYYFSKNRIDYFVTGLITLFIVILLIIPIYALYRVSASNNSKSNATCIGLLVVSSLVFSAILSLFTKARRHEILGASAAYCAVLVVFIGGVNGKGN